MTGSGVAAALLANLLCCSGFLLEKRALTGLPPLRGSEPVRALRLLLGSPLWIAGCAVLCLGFAAQLLAYRTLPIAAAQGILTAGLVLLFLLSSVLLGERPTGRERAGTAIVVVALVMVMTSLEDSPHQVGRTASPVRLLAVSLSALAVATWLYTGVERRTRRRHRPPTSGVGHGVAVGLVYGVSSLATKGTAGLLTAGDVTGSVLGLLRSPYPYLLLFTSASGLVMSQTALQRHRAVVVVPASTTVTCLFAVATGTYAFGDPLPEDPLRLGLQLGGTAVAVLALAALPRQDPEFKTVPKESGHEVRRPAAQDPRLSDRQGTTYTACLPGRAVQPPAGTSLPDGRRHPTAAPDRW